MADIMIRKATSDELPRIEKLFSRIYELTFHREAPCFTSAAAGEAIYIAQFGTDVIGLMTVWEPTDFIHFLFVDKKYRGIGVGSSLLQKAKEVYGNALSLKCLKENQAALSFYLHNGWIVRDEGICEDGKYFLLCTKAPDINNTDGIEVMRAEEEWQRAGAYYVRIHGMNRRHGISLREEFDSHDGNGTRYIVLLDNGYPVATCRFHEIDHNSVMLGRVVVIPEYRDRGVGQRTIMEAERWIRELKYNTILIESRISAVEFYDKLGFTKVNDIVVKSGSFDCVRMIKKFR